MGEIPPGHPVRRWGTGEGRPTGSGAPAGGGLSARHSPTPPAAAAAAAASPRLNDDVNLAAESASRGRKERGRHRAGATVLAAAQLT